jgi:hypothetical protein
MTAAEIRDLSDEDLKQFMFDKVKSQGLERYLSLLTEESESDESKMHIRDDEKVDDYISNSDHDSDDDNDDNDDDEDANEGIYSDDDQSSDESIVDDRVGNQGGALVPLHLHDPVKHPYLHCPPFADINSTDHASDGDNDDNDDDEDANEVINFFIVSYNHIFLSNTSMGRHTV